MASSAAGSERVTNAKVLLSEPLYATPGQAERACIVSPTGRTTAQPIEDLRANRPGLSLAQAIAEALEASVPATANSCTATTDAVVAYRVAFRHADRIWIRTMAERPGATIAVQVMVRAASNTPHNQIR
jgi:hypothetical protein